MSTFKSVVTTLGQSRIAAAIAAGTDISITQLAVGDGNGKATTPVATQTQLVKEVYRTPLNSLKPDPTHGSWVIAEAVISASVGGFWMREMGLFAADGALIAVCNMADTYKPTLAEGSGRTQTLRMVIAVSNTEAISLLIDDSVIMASEQYVNDLLAAHEKSRNHPDGTLEAKGFVQLSSSVSSASETLAATPKAVKAANDNANGRLPSGGTAVAATKLATARKIAGVAFDGTADINLTPENVGALPSDGTAVSAKKLETARKIAGVAFDGTQDITLKAVSVGAVPLSSDGAVEDVKKIRGISSLFTPQSTSPLELGHLGAAGDFYLDIHTDGTELGEDYSHRIHFHLGGDITFQSSSGGAVKIGSAGSIHAAGDLSTENSFLAEGAITAKGDIRSQHAVTSAGLIEAGDGLYDTPGVRAYSPNYRPTPDAINAIARDTCSVAGFANGRVDSPYFRHAETSEVIDLARYTWVNERIAQSQGWANTELRNDIYAYGDNRYIYDVQRGSQALENAGWNAQQVWEAPTGCFMTGLNIRKDLGDCRAMGKYYRALMVKTAGGSWRQVGN